MDSKPKMTSMEEDVVSRSSHIILLKNPVLSITLKTKNILIIFFFFFLDQWSYSRQLLPEKLASWPTDTSLIIKKTKQKNQPNQKE